jgi:hypothetical protein
MAYLPPPIISYCSTNPNVEPTMAVPGQIVTFTCSLGGDPVFCSGATAITGIYCSFAENCNVNGYPATPNGSFGSRYIDVFDGQSFALPSGVSPDGSSILDLTATFQLAPDAFGMFDPNTDPAGPCAGVYCTGVGWETVLPFNIPPSPSCPRNNPIQEGT